MNYRKIFRRITFIALSTIAVIFFMCSISKNNAQAKFLFKTRIDYSVGKWPCSVAIGDMNGDANPDLAVAVPEYSREAKPGNIQVLLGNGDGSFHFKSAVNYSAGDEPSSVALGDLNGDGNLDLAATNEGSAGRYVSVLLGNGDGSLKNAVNYTADGSSIAIGDLDGDGNPDLVTSGVSVLLGNGDGTFQAAVNYIAGGDSVAIGDLDKDGDLDLVVANAGDWYNGDRGSFSVLLGNSDGTFQTAVNYDAVEHPISVAIGDLDEDGNLDLAVANYGEQCGPWSWCGDTWVLLGNGDGTFQNAVNYDAGGKAVAIGDLDGDGDLDIVGADGDKASVSVLLGNGDGSFQNPVNYDANSSKSLALGDLDGDGDLDLVTDGISVLFGNGDGSFQTAVNYTLDDNAYFVAIGDLNGDDDLDLAVSSGNGVSVLLRNGDGTFQNEVNYRGGVRCVAIGDLNGDGDLDLAGADEHEVSVLLGNGDGTFQNAVNYGAGDTPVYVAIGDFNGDANQDIAAANEYSGNVSVLLGNGDGTFQNAAHYGAGDRPWSIAIGDLNGDGAPDLISANQGDPDYGVASDVSVLLGKGDGTFQNAVNYMVGDNPSSVAIGDLNGDANPDLVVGNGMSDNVSVLLGNGDGTFQSAVNYGVGLSPDSVAIGDLNGDGNLDLAAANGYGWSVSILINTGPVIYLDLLYTPVKPCRIVDTRKTSAGMIDANTQRDFRVFGPVGDQGGDSAGCLAPMGKPFAAHINMVAVNPTGKGNLQAFPVGAGTGAGLSVNYNTLDTNLANAGTVKAIAGSGPDITVASNFSSAHAVIDVLGYYYPDDGLLYTPVMPCRIVDTRYTSAGIIDANTERNFRVFGSGGTIFAQGGDSDGCPSPLGEPLAAHVNLVAVNPYGKGNLQAFPVGAETGAGLSVNYNILDTNLANAGTVKTNEGAGADITVASNFSSANTVIDVLGYFYPDGDLVYTPVTPCRIVDTRKTSAGIIDANTERNFRVFGSGETISAQGGNLSGCPSPQGEPLSAHVNMIAVNPTGKGNLQAFPVGAGTGAGLSVNYNTIDTNLANAGTVKTVTGSGTDISVASNFSSAHTVIDVLGYYYPVP